MAIQYNRTLLMREVRALTAPQLAAGVDPLGPLFWASDVAPPLYAAATAALGIPVAKDVDNQTHADVLDLYGSYAAGGTPCNPERDGTLKCESCPGGCQTYIDIDWKLGIANERTHWTVPTTTTKGAAAGSDVIAYRSHDNFLWASVRNLSTPKLWPEIAKTTIPNDNSNLNGGQLPDGRVYLVHNPVTPASGKAWGRDPVTVATSADGFNFDTVGVALTCHNLSATSGCVPRYEGKSKNPGPSYPQAVAVWDPAPQAMQGRSKEGNLPTEILLEVTDGLRRPP